jgi:hypothetical protein
MPKETFWFKHDFNARGDKEMMRMRMKMGMAGIGLYWCIIEMLYEEGGYLMRTEYERIAFELQTKESDVAKLIETYSLFQTDDDRFWSNSALVRISLRASKSKKAAHSANIKWDSIRNANASTSQCDLMPIRGEEIRREEKRGISFSDDRKSVLFDDGTKQELGLEQLRWLKEGNYEPRRIKMGIIE